jgi:hypothetical protein
VPQPWFPKGGSWGFLPLLTSYHLTISTKCYTVRHVRSEYFRIITPRFFSRSPYQNKWFYPTCFHIHAHTRACISFPLTCSPKTPGVGTLARSRFFELQLPAFPLSTLNSQPLFLFFHLRNSMGFHTTPKPFLSRQLRTLAQNPGVPPSSQMVLAFPNHESRATTHGSRFSLARHSFTPTPFEGPLPPAIARWKR